MVIQEPNLGPLSGGVTGEGGDGTEKPPPLSDTTLIYENRWKF